MKPAPTFLVALACCLASLALYAWPMARPTLLIDDFQIVVRSWTWQRTWDELWVPANEHAMPAGRLTTWLLVQAAGRPSRLPRVCGPQGPLALVVGAVLVFLFVRRELGSPWHGLVAMALFGVSTVPQQAVVWFSASFSVLTLDTALLGLLAAQQWRRRGGWLPATLCVAACALAPAWFASGVLAGPLCGLYLLVPMNVRAAHAAQRSKRPTCRQAAAYSASTLRARLGRKPGLRRLGAIALPLAGTLLFLAVSLPRTARRILHLEHYGDSDALRSFHPLTGLGFTLWSVVENLLLGQLGISALDVPVWVVVAVWPVLAVGAVALWRAAPAGRRLMLLGAGTILSAYWLVYSARAEWGYAGSMNQVNWSRYHLLPQLGLALLIAGGLTRWRTPAEGLSGRRASGLLGLIGVLFVTQLPRVLLTAWGDEHAAQTAVLRRVEEVDALCRVHRIDATTARAALPILNVPGSDKRENGWEFLRGSPDPDPTLTVEDARRLLTPFD